MTMFWIVTAMYDTSKSAKSQPRHMRPAIYAADSENLDKWPVHVPRRATPLRQVGDVWNNVAFFSGAYATEAEARAAARNF